MNLKGIREKLTNIVEKYCEWKIRHPYLSTLVETGVTTSLSTLGMYLLIGNPRGDVYEVTVKTPKIYPDDPIVSNVRVENMVELERLKQIWNTVYNGKWDILGEIRKISIQQLEGERRLASAIMGGIVGLNTLLYDLGTRLERGLKRGDNPE